MVTSWRRGRPPATSLLLLLLAVILAVAAAASASPLGRFEEDDEEGGGSIWPWSDSWFSLSTDDWPGSWSGDDEEGDSQLSNPYFNGVGKRGDDDEDEDASQENLIKLLNRGYYKRNNAFRLRKRNNAYRLKKNNAFRLKRNNAFRLKKRNNAFRLKKRNNAFRLKRSGQGEEASADGQAQKTPRQRNVRTSSSFRLKRMLPGFYFNLFGEGDGEGMRYHEIGAH